MTRIQVQDYLPQMKGIERGLRKGRNIYEGYQRGWGIEFGSLREQVRADPVYAAALEACGNRTILLEDHRINLFLLIRFYLARLDPGDIIEFGAYLGGNAIFMAYVARETGLESTVYALDTFAGMPPTDKSVDAHSEGDFANVDYEELVRYTQTLGLSNLKFIKGTFQDTFDGVVAQSRRFSLAHVDCDTYPSVKFSYDAVRSHMVNGGYVAFDDATVSSCLGATEAVENDVIRRDGLNSEQIFPQYVFRIFGSGTS